MAPMGVSPPIGLTNRGELKSSRATMCAMRWIDYLSAPGGSTSVKLKIVNLCSGGRMHAKTAN
eukprot:1225887-Prymnesium_polylepis.1